MREKMKKLFCYTYIIENDSENIMYVLSVLCEVFHACFMTQPTVA